ncbi:MAG: hypothetical protein F4W90_11630 [Gammaproteobacteria bacterium]|nr:hypothetical protein [Gammaproteobacteria bacterium]
MTLLSNRFTYLILIFAVFPFLTGCSSAYIDPDFAQFKQTHKKVAVLPFLVKIDSKRLGDVTVNDIENMQKERGFEFQKQLHDRYLRNQRRGKYTVEFKDVAQINELLEAKSNNHDAYETLHLLTKPELCELLEVDSVIVVNLELSKPLGMATAVATTLLIGTGATERAVASFAIYERDSGVRLWSYDTSMDGMIWTTSNRLVKSLIKETAREFPYRR